MLLNILNQPRESFHELIHTVSVCAGSSYLAIHYILKISNILKIVFGWRVVWVDFLQGLKFIVDSSGFRNQTLDEATGLNLLLNVSAFLVYL